MGTGPRKGGSQEGEGEEEGGGAEEREAGLFTGSLALGHLYWTTEDGCSVGTESAEAPLHDFLSAGISIPMPKSHCRGVKGAGEQVTVCLPAADKYRFPWVQLDRGDFRLDKCFFLTEILPEKEKLLGTGNMTWGSSGALEEGGPSTIEEPSGHCRSSGSACSSINPPTGISRRVEQPRT